MMFHQTFAGFAGKERHLCAWSIRSPDGPRPEMTPSPEEKREAELGKKVAEEIAKTSKILDRFRKERADRPRELTTASLTTTLSSLDAISEASAPMRPAERGEMLLKGGLPVLAVIRLGESASFPVPAGSNVRLLRVGATPPEVIDLRATYSWDRNDMAELTRRPGAGPDGKDMIDFTSRAFAEYFRRAPPSATHRFVLEVNGQPSVIECMPIPPEYGWGRSPPFCMPPGMTSDFLSTTPGNTLMFFGREEIRPGDDKTIDGFHIVRLRDGRYRFQTVSLNGVPPLGKHEPTLRIGAYQHVMRILHPPKDDFEFCRTRNTLRKIHDAASAESTRLLGRDSEDESAMKQGDELRRLAADADATMEAKLRPHESPPAGNWSRAYVDGVRDDTFEIRRFIDRATALIPEPLRRDELAPEAVKLSQAGLRTMYDNWIADGAPAPLAVASETPYVNTGMEFPAPPPPVVPETPRVVPPPVIAPVIASPDMEAPPVTPAPAVVPEPTTAPVPEEIAPTAIIPPSPIPESIAPPVAPTVYPSSTPRVEVVYPGRTQSQGAAQVQDSIPGSQSFNFFQSTSRRSSQKKPGVQSETVPKIRRAPPESQEQVEKLATTLERRRQELVRFQLGDLSFVMSHPDRWGTDNSDHQQARKLRRSTEAHESTIRLLVRRDREKRGNYSPEEAEKVQKELAGAIAQTQKIVKSTDEFLVAAYTRLSDEELRRRLLGRGLAIPS